jgi:hypothetical protein
VKPDGTPPGVPTGGLKERAERLPDEAVRAELADLRGRTDLPPERREAAERALINARALVQAAGGLKGLTPEQLKQFEALEAAYRSVGAPPPKAPAAPPAKPAGNLVVRTSRDPSLLLPWNW